MSKNVFKSLKSLKLPHPVWKKLDNSESSSDDHKKKKKFKGLKKLIPSMGNFTSHARHQQVIDNVDDYATNLMANLTKLRHDGTNCDVTFNNSDLKKAHKIVVSFNQPLLDMANSSSETVAVDIDVCEAKDEIGEEAEIKSEETALESNDQVAPDDDVTAESDGPKSTGDDVTSVSDEAKSTGDDVTSGDENGLVSQLQTDHIEPATFEDERKEEEDEQGGDEKAEENETENETKDEEEKKADEGASTNPDDIAPPLSAELATPTTEKVELPGVADATNDVVCTPPALTNPIDVLINFLYTSHIDITQKNVSSLRVVATQCVMDDVITACNEFDKVLHMETEVMTTNEAKDQVAAQFRYRYSDPSMPSKMLQHFDALRHNDKYTDVTITAPSKKTRLNVHSLVLAGGSNFFQPVLSSKEHQRELEVTEVDESVLELLVDFIYTGRVGVTSQTVSKLMQASDRMQLYDVIEGCAEFLESTLSVQNCVQHRSIGIDYKCDKLKEVAHQFIVQHFLTVSQTPDFMTLSVGGLLEVITSDELSLELPIANGEMAVFKAVKRWVAHDEANRKQQLAEVMSGVRFPLISERHLLDDVTTDILVMANQEMCDHVTGVITSKPNMRFSDDVTMRGREVVVTVGGSYPVADETSEERGYQAVTYSNQFTTYDPSTGAFHELTTLPETRALHCIVSCDQFVFVVGGFDSYSCIVNSVFCFDLSNGTWHKMPHMKIKRSCFSLHVISGYIFAVGGLTPNGYTATVERLDRKRKVWELAKPLPTTRYRHAGCVLDGEILISGGCEKQDTVFSYNPDTDSWKKAHPLNIGRDSHVMLTVNQKAYAIGGDGIEISAEYYHNKTWTMLVQPCLGERLYLPGAAVIGNKIFLFGGWKNENDVVHGVSCFDTSACMWISSKNMMPIPRGSASSCTIRIPRNYGKIKFSTAIQD